MKTKTEFYETLLNKQIKNILATLAEQKNYDDWLFISFLYYSRLKSTSILALR